MFSREIRRQERAKVKYILVLRVVGLPVWLSLWGGGGVHRWQVVRLSGLFPAFVVCSVPLSLSLSALVHLLSCNSPILCLISRFRGVFSGFWGSDVYLYGSRSLRGLCGLCTRVGLGGLKACGVFASMLPSCLPFVFFSCPLVLLSS